MEYYSNILYVKENHAKLSILAHKAHTTDKYREETCCIIGISYHSLPFPIPCVSCVSCRVQCVRCVRFLTCLTRVCGVWPHTHTHTHTHHTR
jgi:hypothetical protein